MAAGPAGGRTQGEPSMLTLPRIIEREAQPYVAVRRAVRMPFSDAIDATMPKLWQWIGDHRVDPAGPPFFKYNVIDMANELEMEFGVPTSTVLTADDEVVVGTLPAGRYASLTYHGRYDDLIEVNAVLIGWCNLHRYAFDMEPTPRGDKFACRLEIYPNDPREVANPADWETVLAFKLRDTG
jgi:effector-binding domain-containing protein